MKRGFVMLAVIIGLAIALLACAALLRMAQAETSGASRSQRQAQAQATARSGFAIILGELQRERRDMLAGKLPELDDEYIIYEREGATGVVRLLPIGPDGERIVSESAKLDVNEVTAEQLVATGLVEDALAQRIIAWRESLGRPVQSLAELAQVPGMTSELLFGSLERLQREWEAFEGADSPEFAGEVDRDAERVLADILTVFSAEANVRKDGTPRIDLASLKLKPAGDDDERTAANNAERDRVLQSLPEPLRPIIAGGASIDTLAKLASALRDNNVPPDDWSECFDACTAKAGDIRQGRLDVNTAPLEALLALPEITAEQAEAIVAAQASLTEAERATVCWPLLAGVLEPGEFASLVDHITNRSTCYRVRLLAGEVAGDELDGPLRDAVVYELVIDFAGDEPRLASVRDMTLMPAMLAVALHVDAQRSPAAERDRERQRSDIIHAWDERQAESAAAADEAGKRGASANDDAAAPPSSAESSPSPNTAANQPAGASAPSPPPLRRIGRWHAGA